MKTTISTIALAVSASLFAVTPAMAETSITELEERIDMLEREMIDAQSASQRVDRVRFKPSTPSGELVSADGRSTTQLKGRIHMDITSTDDQFKYDGSKDVDNGSVVEGYETVNLRRLRLGVEGKFAQVWEYELQMDFAENEVDLKDALVAYRAIPNNRITFGFQKYAFGLESTNSSAHNMFLERSALDQFAPDRNVGIEWRYAPGKVNFRAGASILADDFIDGGEVEGAVANFRITSPVYQSNSQLVHLGASALYNHFNDDNQESRYRARPDHKWGERMVNTGKFDSKSEINYGVEAAYQYRNLLVMGEYVGSMIDRIDGDSVNLGGFNVQAAYTFTGESWTYRARNGGFRAVSPDNPISQGGWGAFEVAARYSYIDLNSADADPMKDIKGGEQTTMVVGLNWYLEHNLKAQFNYVHAEAKYQDVQTAINADKFDTSSYQFRMAYYF
ncbi:OprO/OprP family phosphate-selective porin [Paraferrimonas haliotis]|uniref:Phosphate-selective porin OprO and OprP n=1 Tax=Paraferrimonas haliotis TaxID=2013866 RepID=A0AA37WX31_9GAMM|nr:porin [Paraferrimonas haliotis]GLS82070.1 hypothetical protein GCM10007894_00470 [Paraferrimonas haliotis]